MSLNRQPQPLADVAKLRTASGKPLSAAVVRSLVESHERTSAPRMNTLWTYYRNPAQSLGAIAGSNGSRPYRLAQERGLPARLLGTWDRRGPASRFASDDRSWSRKEIVIENDIAWRVHTMVDFMFGRPVTISSTARDPNLRRLIERVLDAVIESSGGIALLQDMGLLGHVYGHIDLIVRVIPSELHDSDPETPLGGFMGDAPSALAASPVERGGGVTPPGASDAGDGSSTQSDSPRLNTEAAEIIDRATRRLRIDLIEPTRGIALLDESDYRDIDAYIIRTRRDVQHVRSAGDQPPSVAASLLRWWRDNLERRATGQSQAPDPSSQPLTTEIFSGGECQVYHDTGDGHPRLVHSGPSLVEARPGDRPPIVHIQNISQPFEYTGLGEVEPLIPLQDELNTRLSDRASRVTMQSFKMFLAKGLSGASSMPIAPGVVWATENADAQIESFGGDAASPSEDKHIEEIREAMDKASGVPPLASGVVRAKIGNLSSENALKITLMGLLSKTARKRITYGRGISECCTRILDALDRLNILRTSPADRVVRIDWTDPLPRDERQALAAAQMKVELGVPRERVLSELGYSAADPGIT